MIDWLETRRCESATVRSLMPGSGCLISVIAGAEALDEADVLLMLRYTVDTNFVLGSKSQILDIRILDP